MYPRIATLVGYRGSVICGLVLFSVMSVLFPFSNRITGPIGDGSDITESSTFNSSGAEANNISVEFDFCGHQLSGDSSENLVNENSVARIPVKVWSWLIFNLTLWIISRCVCMSLLPSCMYI